MSAALTVLGSAAVGKSSIVIRLVTDSFLSDYDPTCEDSYRKMLYVDGERVVVDLQDTAGQSTQDDYIRQGEGVLLVYNVASHSSFEEARTLRDKVLHIKGTDNVAMVLVGNKSDLKEREVTKEEGEALANKFKCPFFETSAKADINCIDAVNQLFREVVIARAKAEAAAKEAATAKAAAK